MTINRVKALFGKYTKEETWHIELLTHRKNIILFLKSAAETYVFYNLPIPDEIWFLLDILRIIVIRHVSSTALMSTLPLYVANNEKHLLVLQQLEALSFYKTVPGKHILCLNCYAPQLDLKKPYYGKFDSNVSVMYCSAPCAQAHCGFDPDNLFVMNPIKSAFLMQSAPWKAIQNLEFQKHQYFQHEPSSSSHFLNDLPSENRRGSNYNIQILLSIFVSSVFIRHLPNVPI
jgi:hypothetical protein